MKKTVRAQRRISMVVVSVASLALFLLMAGCSGGSSAATIPTAQNSIVTAGAAPAATDSPGPALSSEEQEALLYLREEEKLAHDVYAVLYEKWGTKVFANIQASESRHMASVKTLLDRYGLEDPVQTEEIGVFANEELKQLFDSLVAQGSASEAESLKVGIAIENKDIEDLERLIASTTHSDIAEVAQNLLEGSRNHLEAFSRDR